MGSALKFGLTPRRGRIPDLSLFLHGRLPPRSGPVRIPPDVAVEIVSPSPSDQRRDRVEKVPDYAQFGIRWYWIIDPRLRTFEILELRDGAYHLFGAADHGEIRDIPGCPDLVLDLDALWADVDALPPE